MTAATRQLRLARSILAQADDPGDGPLPGVFRTLGEDRAELRAWDPTLLVHDFVLKVARATGRRTFAVAEIARAFGKVLPTAKTRAALLYWARQGFWRVTVRQEGFRGQLPRGAPLEITLPEAVHVDRREAEERNFLVDALHKGNGKAAEAARLLGVAPDVVRYRMQKHGVAVRRDGGRVTVEYEDRLPDTAYQIRLLTKDDLIDTLLDTRNDVAAAAKALGYSYHGLLNVLHRYGVQRLPTPPGIPARYRDSDEPAKELLLAGGDHEQAARALGITPAMLRHWLRATPRGRATPTSRQYPNRKEYLRALRYHVQGVSEGQRFEVPRDRILRALFEAGGELNVAARGLNLDPRTLQRLMAVHGIKSQREVTGTGFVPGTVPPAVKMAYLEYLQGELARADVDVSLEPHQLQRSPQLRNRVSPRQVVRELLRRGGELAPTAQALLKTTNTRSLVRYLRWEKIPLRSDFPDRKSFLTALQARARALGVDLEPVAGPGVTGLHDYPAGQLVRALIEAHGKLGDAAVRLSLNSPRELRNLLRLNGLPLPVDGQDRFGYLRALQVVADRLGVPRSQTEPFMAGPLPAPLDEIFKALLGSGGNLRQAAQVLGIGHRVLLRVLQRLRVPTPGETALGPDGRAGYLESLVRRGVELGLPEAGLRGHITPGAVPVPRVKLLQALVEAKGNLTRAAVLLGLTFGTVARWMKAYQIPTYQAHTTDLPVGTRQTAYLRTLTILLEAEETSGTREAMLMMSTRSRRLADRLLAEILAARLLEAVEETDDSDELKKKVRFIVGPYRRVAADPRGRDPALSGDAAAGRALSDQINLALGTEVDWADLVQRSLPVTRKSPDHGELTSHLLEDLLINALRERRGFDPRSTGQVPAVEVGALVRSPGATVRDFVRSQWRQSLSQWRRGPRERNFRVVDDGGGRPYREEGQVADPRGSERQGGHDAAKWAEFKQEFEELLAAGSSDRRIADAAVKVFRVRVRNAERVTRGGTSARVTVRTDPASMTRSAQEAARQLVAPAVHEWADLARSNVGGLTAAEVPGLLRYVHATAGAFAERHRGERVAELVYQLFPPRYFEELRAAMAAGPAEPESRLPGGFDPQRARRLILRSGPEQAARQLGLRPADLQSWWAAERRVRAV